MLAKIVACNQFDDDIKEIQEHQNMMYAREREIWRVLFNRGDIIVVNNKPKKQEGVQDVSTVL